ncbi:MAG: diguanylate cyclase [Sulfuricurvum sp.]|uniref:hypothetical protein n=1 Tax=Sulfuricurvum sp. TaxID=2025608 RepID=UPI0025D592DF|nr:hypothetical protein [Sulfuricurvum sp.]MBV5321365.1 diguanylate cyclase [Sulfuricurvum sp.]
MLLSIRKIFSHLKNALLILALGTAFLTLQLFLITDYSDRLGELKKQHLLIDKTVNTDLSDPKMAAILMNGSLSEIALSVKLSGTKGILNSFLTSNDENTSLSHSLEVSSQTFCDSALTWSESLPISRDSQHTRMMNARSDYLGNIDRVIDEQINLVNDSISTSKITALTLLTLGVFVFFIYRSRLNQIYSDIDKACAVDTNGEQKTVETEEIDFIMKRLVRRTIQTPSACSGLVNSSSGLNNQKGLMTAFNSKKSSRANNTIFLAVFEIDQYTSLVNTHSKDDLGNLFRKLGDIISLYEQPLDITAHMDDDHIVFLMSRNSKQIAMEDCEKILHTVEASGFSTAKGVVKITLSGGFLLKIPVKSVDESIEDALLLVQKAKESGGNRIAQLRDRADSYR